LEDNALQNVKVGYIYVFLAASFFAFIGVLGKDLISAGIAPLDLIILQYAATIFLMFGYFIFTDIKVLKLTKHELKRILIQGIIGSSGTTIFFYLALEHVNAGIASMLLFTHPVLISVYFLISKTKKINMINNSALVLAILGSIMVINIFAFDMASTPIIGILFGLLASAAYAFFNIYAELEFKEAKPMVTTFYSSGVILLTALLINPRFFTFDFSLSLDTMFYIVRLAIISGILPVVFLYKGIGIVGADKASIIATAELPITVLLAFFILGEKMSLIQVIGIFLIIASIMLLQNENNIAVLIKKIKRSE
jgi:drug/metabolite transporter (DMT)-like permease